MAEAAGYAIEETVVFNAGPVRLEGRLHRAAGPDAVVITHPHPLYGGELENPVVAALAGVYQRLGHTTLRFNFRGVGASGGSYDDGRGEQDDVRAAAHYLAGLGKTVSDLAGYSFGAWVHLHLDPSLATVRRQLLVAPPVAYLEFNVSAVPAAELRVIVGDRDPLAPLAQLREQMLGWHPSAHLQVLPGADHFYVNALGRLAALAEQALNPLDNRCSKG